jgi:hypothetical protein
MDEASFKEALINDLADLSGDPYRFVLWAFPWGEKNTFLENRPGPEPWQAELLMSIRDGLSVDTAIRQATVSGNGVGKSTVVAWIILWAMSTFEDTVGVVTANTETQLRTKTWSALGKWFYMFIAKDLFKLTATALISRAPEHERTWRTDMVPWSEHNLVAFQGLHNEGKRLFMIYDEASGIPDGIWEAGDGCMTDANTQRIWCVFGNPNLPKGRFRECFDGGRFQSTWIHRTVDSRSVSFTDKTELQKWIDDYGEDNDFVRVRVRGVFPRTGSMQFISSEAVDEAQRRDVSVHLHDPLVFGVDVARYGDDASVIYIRKGRDGRSHPPILLRGLDTMTVASRVAEEYLKYRPDAVFVDGGGVGGGVLDRLRQIRVPAIEIQFGGKADRTDAAGEQGIQFANKRAEMWGALREWLKGGSITDDKELKAQLINIEYGFNGRNEILLEKKEDMKKRGLESPDIADALALTFAYPVIPNALAGRDGAGQRPLLEVEYDPMARENAA